MTIYVTAGICQLNSVGKDTHKIQNPFILKTYNGHVAHGQILTVLLNIRVRGKCFFTHLFSARLESLII